MKHKLHRNFPHKKNTSLLSLISSVFLHSGEQFQSQAVTKETDEKLLYIHTPIYISQTFLLSLPLIHTRWLSCSLSHPRKLHTLCSLWQRQPPPSYTLYPSIPLSSLSAKVSALLFIHVFPSVSVFMCDCVCVCGGACETAGAEPSNGHIPNTCAQLHAHTHTHINNHCKAGFMKARPYYNILMISYPCPPHNLSFIII